MKKQILYIAVAVATLAGCHKYEPIDPKNYDIQGWEKTVSVSQFLSKYMTEKGVFFPVRTRANGTKANNLFSVDTIPKSGNEVIIRGRVISEDVSGNIYKTLYIQDEQDPKQGLKLSVDGGSLSGQYALGQLIAIRCNGLAIGKYADQPQLAVPHYNNNTLATNYTQKIGWEPGRIPLPMFQKAVQCIGLPEPKKIVVHEMTIPQILSGKVNELSGRLVRIRNVYFNQKYSTNGNLDDCTTGSPDTENNSHYFAPTTNNIGYAQGRAIEDASGNWILVSTSEYAKFATVQLPESEYKGDIVGIISYYYDNANYPRTNSSGVDYKWSIVIRSLNDLQLKNAAGNIWRADNIYYPNY